MRTVLTLSLLAIFTAQLQGELTVGENSTVDVLSSRWAKTRLTVDQAESASVAPAAAMINANKVRERERRADVPAGARDPNEDTVDFRSNVLEKNVQASRAPKPLDGFVYRIKVHNSGTKAIETLFWEYAFVDRSDETASARRQFLCAVDIKPNKDKELEAFSVSGPSDVVSVDVLSKKSAGLVEEKVVINRVEYTDGSIWQRKGWHLRDVKVGYERALKLPWAPGRCRGL
jgi:hypothetical protein